MANDEQWLRSALAQAAEAELAGEVPVGAIVVADDSIIAASGNRTERDQDATAHAEMLVLTAASAVLGTARLEGCELYVTLEPCAMCAGAIVLARVGRVVFGAWDDKAGMGGSVGDILRHPRLNHHPDVRGGLLADECGALLTRFFAARRSGARAASI